MDKMIDSAKKKLLNNLLRIENGELFFFNITQYNSLGLIEEKNHYKKDSSGNRVRINTTYHLTSKARIFIKSVI